MNSAIYFASKIDPLEARKIREICDNLKITLLFENDFTNLIRKIVRTKPRFVFLGGDGPEITYMSRLATEEIHDKFKIIIISDHFECNNELISVVGINQLENFILNLKDFYFYNLSKKPADFEMKIKRYLLDLGFNASSKGFDYIFECISLLIENNQYKCLKECYQIIKCNYEINNESTIDRDMRFAISNAYELNKDNWSNMFCKIFSNKPTCKNFICLSATRIKEDLIQV